MDDRYQHQPWYIRLWRRRHQVLIPWNAWLNWKCQRNEDEYYRMSFRCCWSLAVGMSHGSMKWYYTLEEIQEDLRKKLKSGQDKT